MADDSKTTAPSTEPSEQRDGNGADEFGTTLGPDGIDPELVNLSRSSNMRIGVVMSISVLIFCGYIMYKVYPDLRFSRSSDSPVVFGSAAELLRDGAKEQLVQVRAVPDRSFAIHVSHSIADDGSRLTPIQGTDGGLWLMVGGNVWKQFSPTEVYTGRLRLARDLPFYDDFREHVAEREPVLRFATPRAVRAALEARQHEFLESAGDRVKVIPTTPVQVYETVVDQAQIQVFPTDRRPRERDLTGALVEAGLITAGFKPERGPKDSWVYVVNIIGGVDAARAKLRAAKLFNATCVPLKRIYDATWQQVTSRGKQVSVGKHTLHWRNITWIAVQVPRTLPADAMVVVTQEAPGHFWYVLPLFVILGLAALFFAYPLVRRLTRKTLA